MRWRFLGLSPVGLEGDAARPPAAPADPSKDDVEEFLTRCIYVCGQYDKAEDLTTLAHDLTSFEGTRTDRPVGRLFYLALPPKVYPTVCKGIRDYCNEPVVPIPRYDHETNSCGCGVFFWTRLIIEKPFGHDLESSEKMSAEIGALFPEEQIYRIDHYLGKELAQNMMVLRFANQFLEPIWNRQYISNVQIVFKEPFGTEGRGGYFDSSGILRDVMQNHLLQVLALLAMERPVALQPDDIREEKLKVLRAIPPLVPEDCVLGQYTAADGKPGYLDDPTVPKGSKQATFACCVLRINNPRWAGVPFIMKAGKASGGVGARHSCLMR